MGDFGKYVIPSRLRHFSRYPLSSPRPQIDRKGTYPEELAQRWIFERVLLLGWTPEKFAEFDEERTWVDRSDHKPERFGKKYQWIALHELIARIADNFHMTDDYNDQPGTYTGPWQFYGRAIDPTLLPPRRIRNENDEFDLGPTFSSDRATWWIPSGPRYRHDDPPVAEGWPAESDAVPEFDSLVRRKRHSLMGRWMPEGCEHTDAAYLGELPWASATDEYPNTWEEVRAHGGSEPIDIKVYPAWAKYYWEGNVLDCSIDEGVSAWFPSPVLFKEGKLSWIPGTREWRTPNGVSAAR